VQCREWVIAEEDYDPSHHQALDPLMEELSSADPAPHEYSKTPAMRHGTNLTHAISVSDISLAPKTAPQPSKAQARGMETPSSTVAEAPDARYDQRTPYTPVPFGMPKSTAATPLQLFDTPVQPLRSLDMAPPEAPPDSLPATATLPSAMPSSVQAVMPSNSQLALPAWTEQGMNMSDVEKTLMQKIEGAGAALAGTDNVQDCRALCCLINEAAQALQSIRSTKH